jgi:SAM-dependent methyltransferase
VESEVYAAAARVEEDHWWFRGRRAIVRSVLARYASGRDGKILEVGCGNGGNLSLLAGFGDVTAVEMDAQARARAAARGVARVTPGWLPDGLPFEAAQFDLVAALDVLEHVPDEPQALAALRRQLRPGALLLLTVPAYQWLWGAHDTASHHQRRYTRGRLVARLRAAGLQPVYASYFNTLLFPLAVAYIKGVRPRQPRPAASVDLPPAPLNRLLGWTLAAERAVIPRWRLPYGVSIVACARPA